MVVNREEALRCLTIARVALGSGDHARARRFVLKSISLHETTEATTLLSELESKSDGSPTAAAAAAAAAEEPASSGASATTGGGPGLRHRHAPQQQQRAGAPESSSSHRAPKAADASSDQKREYTPDQANAVRRIQRLQVTEFYAILDIERSASEAEVKKAYRKLALTLHPDKNAAPGADEAFKKVSKAFSVLSDPAKRDLFDRHGEDPDARGVGRAGGGGGGGGGGGPGFASPFGAGGFDGEIDPEEIFRAFFGPGFSFGPEIGVRRRGGNGFYYTQFGGRGPRAQRGAGMGGRERAHAHGAAEEGGAGLGLLQFAPLLVLILFTLLNSWTSGPEFPDYSFSRTGHYSSPQKTHNHGIPFYVHRQTWNDFRQRYSQHTRSFLESVESTYVNKLANDCRRELKRKSAAMDRVRGWGFQQPDPTELANAQNMPTPSCDKLGQMGYSVN